MPIEDVAIFDEIEPESPADFTPHVRGFANVNELIGEYDFTIIDVNTRRNNETPIINIKLRVGDGKTGQAYDWDHWLRADADKQQLAGYLEQLGFRFQKPFGAWLQKTLPALVGVRFKAVRKDRAYKDNFSGEEKTARNFRILTRLTTPASGPPAPAAPPAPQRRATMGASEDIPF